MERKQTGSIFHAWTLMKFTFLDFVFPFLEMYS